MDRPLFPNISPSRGMGTNFTTAAGGGAAENVNKQIKTSIDTAAADLASGEKTGTRSRELGKRWSKGGGKCIFTAAPKANNPDGSRSGQKLFNPENFGST